MNPLPYAARRLAEITQRSPLPEIDGDLSRSERESIHEADFAEAEARRSALEIHAKAVERAKDARARVLAILDAGIPTKPLKGDPDARERDAVAKAIDAFARSQCWLREAAQSVVDICEYDDNGKAAGVIWETPLATEARNG